MVNSTIDGMAAARRVRRVAQAEEALATLQQRYGEQIAANTDDAADKTAAAILRAEVELRTAQLAVEVGRRVEAEAADEQDRLNQERKLEALRGAIALLRAEGIAFEVLVTEQLYGQWCRVAKAEERVVALAAAAHIDLGKAGVTPWGEIWNRVWMRFSQLALRDKNYHPFPAGRSPSRQLPSVAESFDSGAFTHSTAAKLHH